MYFDFKNKINFPKIFYAFKKLEYEICSAIDLLVKITIIDDCSQTRLKYDNQLEIL